MSALSVEIRIHRYDGHNLESFRDWIATESPLIVELTSREFSDEIVILRTPGHDNELIHGLLLCEGVSMQGVEISLAGNRMTVFSPTPIVMEHSMVATTSCSLCGRNADAIETGKKLTTNTVVPAKLIVSLPAAMRTMQQDFEQTGATHSAALFDKQGNILVVREDIGRHNAVDKVVGYQFLQKSEGIGVVLSGRISFDLIRKASQAQLQFVVAVSAPTSMAVQFANDLGITLCGFVRGESMNVYTHPHRITLS